MAYSWFAAAARKNAVRKFGVGPPPEAGGLIQSNTSEK